jgi:hypothetical protein
MPTVRISCGGGLGNRFAAVIGGLRAAWEKGFDAEISWSTDTNCGASLEDMFSHVPAKITYEPSDPTWPLVSHMGWEGRKWVHVDQWQSINTSFEYTHNEWVGDAKDVLRKFVIREEILKNANDFIAKHGIDSSWVGLHVRYTDKAWNDGKRIAILNWASNIIEKNKNVFLCSDDKEIYDMFSGKVLIYPKTHHVQKLFPNLEWRITPKDGVEHHCYNVKRSKEATIQALEDAIILSKTNIMCLKSTFCNFARSL